MKSRKIEQLSNRIPFGERLLLASALGSILGSIFLYFFMNQPLEAIFIGIWAPTIIGLVNFINLKFKK